MISALKYVFSTYGNFTLSYVSRNLDNLLIGKFYGLSALGFYDRAYHLAMLLPNQLSGSLTSVAITALSRLRDDEPRYKRNLEKLLSIISFVAMPLCIILALNGKDIVLILLGPQWGTAGEIFTAFAPTIGLMIIHATPGWVHLSLGRADRWLKWGFVRVFCAAIAIVIGLIWGPKGVATAYSIYMALTLLPSLLYAGKPIGINLSFLLRVLWRYVAAGIFAILSYELLITSFAEVNLFIHESNPFIRIALITTGTIASYCGCILLLYRGATPFYLLHEFMRELTGKSNK